MTFFNVDKQKCRCCGICIEECPNKLILLDDEIRISKLRIQGEEDCLLCGHCVAACPFHALNLAPLPKNGFIELQKDLNISFEQADQFLKSRRSIRTFKKKDVPAETLNKIMDVARFAPTASHKQAIRWVLVKDPVKNHRLAEMVIEWMSEIRKKHPEESRKHRYPGLIAGWRKGKDMILRGAPHLAIAYSDEKTCLNSIDATIALTYVELAAHSLGVGACWAGFFTHAVEVYPPIKEMLGIPETTQVHGGQMLGFPKYPYTRFPWRKPLDIKII